MGTFLAESSTRLHDVQQAVALLEAFCAAANAPFDRIVATRALQEAVRSIPGDCRTTWTQRLVEVGESVELRVRAFEAELPDVLPFAQQGLPVATCLEHDQGDLEWVVVVGAQGGQFQVLTWRSGEVESRSEQWLRTGQLARRLAVAGGTNRWVLGQAALPCDPPAGHSHAGDVHAAPTPLARLGKLLRPERKDLWVVALFSVLVGVLTLATPVAVEALVNTVAFGQFLQPIIVLSILLFTFLAFAAGMRALIALIVEILQRRLFVRVVEDLSYRLPRVKHDVLDGQHGPELVNRFFDVVTVQKSMAALLLDGIAIVLQTFIGMAVLAFYHPFLLGFDVGLLALIALIVFGLGRGATTTSIKESKAKYSVAAWLQELARHSAAFKLHAGAQFAMERSDQLAVSWLEARRAHFKIVLRQLLFALGLQAIAATALLGLGGWLVVMGELTLGQLVAAELIVMVIVGSFAKLGKHLESFYDLLASVDKLGHLFDLPTESHDKLFHLADTTPATIALHKVSYRYGVRPAVTESSLHVPSGSSYAVVGSSACGKTTLLELMAGLRQPTSGRVELDGIDMRELRPDSLREHLALARGAETFAGTINENIHLNRTHLNAKDVRDALELVELLDEIMLLDAGLNTPLQTGGKPLTASQAARLMVARAVVGRPRLLLIDGTLDALDAECAQRIVGRLCREDAPWSLVIATTRPEIAHSCQHQLHLPVKQSALG